MKKFSEYASNEVNENLNGGGEKIKSSKGAFDFLRQVASKYEGASESELISAIMLEAQKARERGELSNEEIDNFAKTIYPMLSPAQRKQLNTVIERIKQSN